MKLGIGDKAIRTIKVFAIALVLIVTGAINSYAFELNNPENTESPMTNNRVSVWDAVRLGNYPQTEIVASGEQSGAHERIWAKSTDYLVDAELYTKLEAASYDSKGDATVNGIKYRRVHMPDTYTQREEDYIWDGTPEYHYFRYEPVKWLVLEASEGKLLLLTEDVLACMAAEDAENWVKSEFAREASIGNVSADLLAVDDIANTDKAVAYGFQKDPDQHFLVRWASSSTYAKACGCKTNWIVSNYNYSAASWILADDSAEGYKIAAGSIQECSARDMIGVRPVIRVSKDFAGIAYAGKTRALNGVVKQEQTISAPAEVSVAIGKTINLNAEACTSLTYTIDNDEVASISEGGVITPKKTGTAIAAINAADTEEFGAASTEVAITVTPRVLTAPVLNSPKLTTYKNVRVSWKAVTGAESYELLWKRSDASEWKVKKTFERSVVLDQLSAGHKYNIKVRAIGELNSPYSTVTSIRTLKKVATPTVKRYSRTKATVKWSAVTGASGYQFYSENMKSHRGSYVTRQTTSLRSTGLYKGIKYRYKVRAYKLIDGKRIYAPWSEYREYRHGY